MGNYPTSVNWGRPGSPPQSWMGLVASNNSLNGEEGLDPGSSGKTTQPVHSPSKAKDPRVLLNHEGYGPPALHTPPINRILLRWMSSELSETKASG